MTDTSNVSPIRKPKGTGSKSSRGRKTGAGWDPEEIVFDTEAWYTRATGPSGLDGTTIYVKFPPTIIAHVARIVASGRIPAIKSIPDFIRHSTTVQLHDVSSKADDDPEFQNRIRDGLRDLTASQHMATYLDEMAHFNAIIKAISEAVKAAEALGDYFALRNHLLDLLDLAEEYRDPLRSKMIGLIREYLAKIPKASSKPLP